MMDASVTRRRMATVVLWMVALLYAYGALVHVLNIAGLSGFDWSRAPAKWQALDIVYLGLDLIVVVGFIRCRRAPRVALPMAYAAFYLAACSQIVLYTVLRSWITDVPAEFAVAPDQSTW